jgi:putative ABC transport system permease protein
MGQGIRPAIAGLCAGAVAAILLSRYMTGMLVGVQPLDPLTYVLGSVLLIGTGLIACYVPARRAMRTDPALALRGE